VFVPIRDVRGSSRLPVGALAALPVFPARTRAQHQISSADQTGRCLGARKQRNKVAEEMKP
jgi:hypothetical protein